MHLLRFVLTVAVGLGYAGTALGQERTALTAIPAIFKEGRVFVAPVTPGGDTLVFYTDTGGGMNMLYSPAVRRLGLPVDTVLHAPQVTVVAPWPEWSPDRSIPLPVVPNGPAGERLVVMPFEGPAALLQSESDAGFLGRAWFAGRTWVIDYPARTLSYVPSGALPPHDHQERVELGFLRDEAGRVETHFPRITIKVEGEPIEVLLDTGASVALKPDAAGRLGVADAPVRASSFISQAVFERWRVAHPDWEVIESATVFGSDLIRVPGFEIADQRVGPVWFESRPEGVFEVQMSRLMDRQIVGALGGNALAFFRLTLSYPHSIALFQPAEVGSPPKGR